MRKLLLMATVFTAIVSVQAGGLLTNTNQSVHFLRNPARDASTEIDAVYTNPAGLSWLPDGFHITLNNQSAFQTRTITSTFAGFAYNEGNNGSATKTFKGEASAPLIPSLEMAYKKDRFTYSLGFAVSGGGGKATFNKGLPSFEAPVSMIPAGLTAMGVPTTQYSLESYMEGKQFIYGIQMNGTYKFTDNFSGALGLRLNIVSSSYEGYLRNIQINPVHPALNPTGAMMSANTFFSNAAAAAQGAANSLQPIVNGGYGSYTMAQLVSAGVLTSAQVAQLGQGLGKDVSTMQASQVQTAYNTSAAKNTATANATADKELDCTQTGWGVTPIIGVNYHYNNLNIGVKYEFKTSLNVENDTKVNSTGNPLYDDGVNTPNDIPAYLAIGAEYKIFKALKVSAGYHHFFDSEAKMSEGKQKYINGGINEYLLGAEYKINEKFLVSAGGQITRTGVTDDYQKDMSFSLNSYSIGFGGAMNVTKKLRVNIAYFFTNYSKWTKEVSANENYYGTGAAGTDVYDRTNKVFGIGVDYSF